MQPSDKQRLVAALMGGIPERSMPEPILTMCVEEVDMMESVIDDMLQQAHRSGKFEALLELAFTQGQRLSELKGQR